MTEGCLRFDKLRPFTKMVCCYSAAIFINQWVPSSAADSRPDGIAETIMLLPLVLPE